MRLVFRGMSEESLQINCRNSNLKLKHENIRLQTTKKEHHNPGVFLFFPNLLTESKGFEPSCRTFARQTDFESASLQPLRYDS